MKQKTRASEARPPLCHVKKARPDVVPGANALTADNSSGRGKSKRVGAVFEALALDYLRRQRLRLIARNVTCRGGEIDLVMRDRDGALVFVEVRARARSGFGGAAASIGVHKRQRLLLAAQYFLARRADTHSACRFDVIAFEAGRLVWLRDAFRADGT